MSCFSRFCKKGTTVNKKLSIDENLYQDLTELSNSTYDASISKLVNAAIEDLITTKNVALYKKENTNQVSRSFLIREDFLNGLYELKRKLFCFYKFTGKYCNKKCCSRRKNGIRRIRQIELVKKYHEIIIKYYLMVSIIYLKVMY